MPHSTQVPINKEQGGARMTVGSGGSIDIESGGEIDIESGGALKIAGTEIDATAAELNFIAGVTAGTAAADKAVVLDSSKGIATITSATIATLNSTIIELSAGAAAAAVAQRFGASATEGYEIFVINEVVDLGSSGASFDLTEDVPSGAIILSAQANLQDLISATTAVKVGLGISGDEDKYGKTSNLTQNQKIDTIPTHAVLGSAEDIQIFAVDTSGAAAGVIGGTGEEVRVYLVYAALNSLDDA